MTSSNELSRDHSVDSLSIDDGSKIDFRFSQPENSFAPILLNLDPDSHVNDESDLQLRKTSSPISSTEDGREIDCNDAWPESAVLVIMASFESNWNVKDESEV
jgi:hypothetical protein